MINIDFWFSIGSTYTYLTVTRLEHIEWAHGVRFRWRPFSVRAVMNEIGNIPFVGKPAKMNYMWRDIERRAARYEIPISLPVSYPLEHFDLANRIAVVGRQEGWCQEYVSAAYKAWFQLGKPAGSEANLTDSLAAAGQSIDRVVKTAESPAAQEAYENATADALGLGIFGSPTFVVNGTELFWGDDRLEDAVQWALKNPERSV